MHRDNHAMRRKEGMAKVVDSNDGVQAAEAAGAAAGVRPAFDLHGEYRFKVDDKGRVMPFPPSSAGDLERPRGYAQPR